MLQRDYFMRMTEMLAAVLAKVIFNKEKKNYEDAQMEIETAAKTIVGLDLNIIKILSAEDIINLMKTSDVYGGRCLVSAELLNEYADINVEKNLIEDGRNFYLKSLWLYSEAILSKELPQPENYFQRVNMLLKKLSDVEFPATLMQKLFEYYEFSGQYSKAEDILFELIDNGSEGIYETGISFYKRLQLKSEDELLRGNLNHEEVEESLNEIINNK